MRYLEALLAVVVFVAAASLAFPRIAPIAVRVGLIAAIVIAALWLYSYVTSRPPPLASRVLELIRARGPLAARDIVAALGADPAEVEKALEYLVERGAVRRIKRGDVEYYDI